MLISCWSAKGGSGTTVVSSALSLVLARRSPAGALLVDLAADAAPTLGLPDPDSPGVCDWLAGGHRATPAALGRLEVEVGGGLCLLGPGRAALPAEPPIDLLVRLLEEDPRPVVVDCGTLARPLGPHVDPPAAHPSPAPLPHEDAGDPGTALRARVAAGAPDRLLVLRPCYLALRRALASDVRPTGLVVVHEPGRALGPAEVEDVLGVPVVATVAVDPSVARAVDAGLLVTRLPRALVRSLGAVA